MLMPPPGLHIFLGFGNDSFDLLVDRLKHSKQYLDIIKRFLNRFNLERDKYFTGGRDELAGQFNGNSCKKFMDNIPTLEQYLSGEPEALRIALPILEAMKAFNRVRMECFGVDLDPYANYKESIATFAHLWKKCDRSITLKTHALFVHVVQFLELMKDRFPGKGLGFWMEQAGESVHGKWEECWEESGRKMSHSDYDSHLLDRGTLFNHKHYGDQND